MNGPKASQELLKTIQLGVIAIQVIFVCVSVKTFTNTKYHCSIKVHNCFQLMQILGLLGMYFDAVVVFVKKTSLLFRLALAILCVKLRQ